MTSKQQQNGIDHEKISKKNFSTKNLKKISSEGYPKYAYIRAGDPPPILFTFENFTALKTPFLLFFPFLYFFMGFFGIQCSLFRLCTGIYPF